LDASEGLSQIPQIEQVANRYFRSGSFQCIAARVASTNECTYGKALFQQVQHGGGSGTTGG